MSIAQPTPEAWLRHEDRACLASRAKRLTWLLSATPAKELWLFPGGWLAMQQFEEARSSFVYGQFVATVLLGLAFVERTLAAMFFGGGRNDLQRATAQQLFEEAHRVGWLSSSDLGMLETARTLRNPLTHFRRPMHEDLPDVRAFKEEREPSEVLEQDAKSVLEAVFKLVARNAVA